MQCSIFYSWFQRKWEHNQFYSWPQWNTNMNDKFSTGLWKQEDLEHGPGIGLGLQRESTAVGKGYKTPLPVLLVPEPWKAMQATASSFVEGITIPQLLVGGAGLAFWGSSFLLHPSSAPFLFPPPFHCKRPGLLSLGRKDHFFLCFRGIWNFVAKTWVATLAMWLS